MKNKGIAKSVSMTLLVVVIIGVVAVLALSGGFQFPLQQITQQQVTPTGVTLDCPDDKSSTVSIVARNPQNTTGTIYNAPTVSWVQSDGKTFLTEAGTAGSTRSPSTGDSLNCGEEYRAIIADTSSFVGSSKISYVDPVSKVTFDNVRSFVANGAAMTIEIESIPIGEVQYMITDASGNNLTVSATAPTASGDGWCSGCTTSANQAMSSGDTLSRELKLRVNGSGTGVGSEESPNYICFDFTLTAFSRSNGIVVTGLQESPTLPAFCSADADEKAYVAPALRATAGEYIYPLKIYNDLTSAVDGDNVIYQYVDSAYFTGGDGSIKIGTADDALTNVGWTQRTGTQDIT